MQPAPIWLPDSHFYREAVPVDKAVNEYDERLHFGQNQSNGQWCIFMEEYGERIPILGFERIPHPEDALKRLYHADARRHGQKILDDMVKHNEEVRDRPKARVDEAIGELAEAVEYGAREDGLTTSTRIFVPGRD